MGVLQAVMLDSELWGRALALLADAGAKGAVLLALAAVAAAAMRRSSAARRHLVWMLAVGGLLALPAASLLMPPLSLAVLPAPAAKAPATAPVPIGVSTSSVAPAGLRDSLPRRADFSTGRGGFASPASPASGGVIAALPFDLTPAHADPWSWRASIAFWLVAAWLAGALAAFVPFLAGELLVGRMIRRAEPVGEAEWRALIQECTASLGLRGRPRILLGAPGAMPLAAGLARSVVLLPREAAGWPEAQRRVVLLHELARVRRRDCLAQAVARLAAALHWFDPLVWLALGRLRAERERACDDLVLASGEAPTAYAEQLLRISRAARGGGVAGAAAIAMARPGQLEGRVRAILDAGRRRGGVRRRGLLLGIGALLLLCLPLGMAQLDQKPPAGVPQTPVERAQSMLHLVAQAVGMFRIDTNALPRDLAQLTTPVGYLSNVPMDPFASGSAPAAVHWLPDAGPRPMLTSVGPDGIDQGGLIVYDPTNGSVSAGDLVETVEPGPVRTHKEIYGTELGHELRPDSPVGELIAALRSDNSALWGPATGYLGQRRAEADVVVPALIEALGQPQKSIAAIQALGLIGPAAEGAIPALIRLLGADPEGHGRDMEAAQALVRIGQAVVPALREAARPVAEADADTTQTVQRIWASAALVRLDDPDPAYLRYLWEAMQSRSARIASKGEQALGTLGPKAAPLIPELSKRLQQPGANQRAITAVLAHIGGPEASSAAAPGLLALLDSKDPTILERTIHTLRMLTGVDPAKAVPPLIRALQFEAAPGELFASIRQARVRSEAAQALASFGAEARAALPILLSQVNAEDEHVRADAVLAIGRIDPTDPAVLAALVRAMHDPSVRVSQQANQILAEMGPVNLEVTRAFIRMAEENAGSLGDGRGTMSMTGPPGGPVNAVVTFFWGFGPGQREAVPDLIAMTRDPRPGVQQLGYRALGRIGVMPDALMPRLIALAEGGRVQWAADVLHDLGPKAAPAAPAMIRMLRDGDGRRQSEAFRVIDAIGSPGARDAIPVLTKLIRSRTEYDPLTPRICETLLKLQPDSEPALDGLEKLAEDPKRSADERLAWRGELLLHGRKPEVQRAALRAALEDPGGAQRQTAVQVTLRTCSDPALRGEALTWLFRALDGEGSANSRSQAHYALRDLRPGDEKIKPDLVARLTRWIRPVAPSPELAGRGLMPRVSEVGLSAIIGLGRLGPAARPALPALRDYEDAPDSFTRRSARDAIAKIEGRSAAQ